MNYNFDPNAAMCFQWSEMQRVSIYQGEAIIFVRRLINVEHLSTFTYNSNARYSSVCLNE